MTEALDDEYSKVGDIIYDMLIETSSVYLAEVQKKLASAGYVYDKQEIQKC